MDEFIKIVPSAFGPFFDYHKGLLACIKSVFKEFLKFGKILFENTTIISHEINKIRLQILEALHMKQKN